MQGVGEHSDFRNDPLGRLRRTVFFLGTTTYCALPEAEAAIEAVRRVHLGVSGVTPDGRRYRADDADLLAWVHATEVDSFLEAFLRYGRRPRRGTTVLAPNLPRRRPGGGAAGGISRADLPDRYVAEMATVAERLGVDGPPRSRAELTGVIDGFRPVVAATDLGRQAAYFLRTFPLPPWPGWPTACCSGRRWTACRRGRRPSTTCAAGRCAPVWCARRRAPCSGSWAGRCATPPTPTPASHPKQHR